jgi:hypothetical protein
MLYVSAFLSLVLLAVIGGSLVRGSRPTAGTVALGIAFLVMQVFGGYFLPCFVVQCVVLLGVHLAASFWQLRAMTYFVLASVGTLVIYAGYGSYFAVRLPQLREQLPLESMEARLPAPKTLKEAKPDPVRDPTAFQELESAVGSAGYFPYRGNQREHQLRRLHEDAVGAFTSSFGFGSGRMTSEPITDWSLNAVVVDELTLAQPAYRGAEDVSADPGEWLRSGSPEPELMKLHVASFLDFVYPEGFGYFKDRQHVAGFRPHQFRKAPAKAGVWKVETIDLVGLALNEVPVVYVSKTLPRMDELRKTAKVRALDDFECAGLADLQGGETLYVREQGNRLRVLGGLRATQQCVECHGCTRGDLLGAFSYVLSRQ